jgi:hypothetical protein
MSAAEKQSELIALRALELRTRELSLDAQMVECVDLLQSPEFVVEDLVRSVEQATGAAGDRRSRVSLQMAPAAQGDAFFYPSRKLFVQGDACSFTCLATEIDISGGSPGDATLGLIDYAAVTCEARPFPILGFTQGSEAESAYPILLRSLSTLIDLATENWFNVLDREIYHGILGPAPAFDLTLVLWDEEEEDPRRPLWELTRDLAEVLKTTLAAETRFPPILNHIVCLRMNPKRFDGRLRFVWRV